jgi:hypothetical protein
MCKLMKTLMVFILILMFCLLSYGQAKYFSFKDYKIQPDIYRRDYFEGKAFTPNLGKSETIDFSFPIFSNLSNQYAASKINQMLQISELEILKGFETESIFERISYDGGGIYGGRTDVKFKVQNNNNRVLSIEFHQSSCGATCTYWVKYYNFNSGNGDLVQLTDLFIETVYQKFFEFVTKRRIADLKKELVKKVEPDEREHYSNIINCYEKDNLEDYYIKNNVLYIDGENCFHKGQKFDGIERISKFKTTEFKKYLNTYGKSLFSVTKDSIKKYRSNALPQLFQGTIAGQNVLMVLNIDYFAEFNEAKAKYVYSKYGKGIFLIGKIDNNELTLTEKLPKVRDNGLIDYVDNGFIKAEFDGQKIVGTWTNKDKTETHELSLKRK